MGTRSTNEGSEIACNILVLTPANGISPGVWPVVDLTGGHEAACVASVPEGSKRRFPMLITVRSIAPYPGAVGVRQKALFSQVWGIPLK